MSERVQPRRVSTQLTQARLMATRPRSERADPALVARLVAALDGRGWVRRRVLCAELGMTDDALRAVARFSRGEIVGSSAKGYALTRQASVEDVGAVVGEWLSRSKHMRARVAEVLAVMHGRPHALPPGFEIVKAQAIEADARGAA